MTVAVGYHLSGRALEELWDMFERAADDAPHVDSCRPYGIAIDPALLPPDDRLTDVLAALGGPTS